MRSLAGFVIGFAVGAAALGGFLYSTGRLKTADSKPMSQSVVSNPRILPLDLNLPVAQPAPLPAPPNLALTSPPAQTETMKRDSTLADRSSVPEGGRLVSIGLPIVNLQKAEIQDTFNDIRGGGTKHEATDIMEPRGTPVHAVVEGNVVKLFNSKKGGTTLYQYDNAQRYCYYYAHLDRYADSIKEGMLLREGDVLGYVGSTGDANAAHPHLHFTILELGPEKRWYENTVAINPYPLLMEALGKK